MFDGKKVIRLSVPGWEGVFRAEIQAGVIAIIAVHDTSRGRALGGCRMAQYDNEAEALTDVLRLSKGMTFKNAIADLPLGGGKSVILCDAKVGGQERRRILEEFGKFIAWVNSDRDAYATAEDMNTTVADMQVVKNFTHHIFGTTIDPSPYTAWGVFSAIAFTVDYFAMDLFEGERGLRNKKVLVQGLGKVGWDLLEPLHRAGARLFITDIKQEVLLRAVRSYPGTTIVDPDAFLDADVDIFVPCARGEVVTKKNLDRLKFRILCGSANNQLQNSRAGIELQKRGIIYCPDYVASMGGVCSIQYIEVENLSKEDALQKIRKTVRKMLGLTFRTAFRRNLAFSQSVDYVVKKIVWSDPTRHTNFSNQELFPLTYTCEPTD